MKPPADSTRPWRPLPRPRASARAAWPAGARRCCRASSPPTGTSRVVVEGRPRYEEVRPLGSGGQAFVTLTRDHDIDRVVALKRLLPENNDDAAGACASPRRCAPSGGSSTRTSCPSTTSASTSAGSTSSHEVRRGRDARVGHQQAARRRRRLPGEVHAGVSPADLQRDPARRAARARAGRAASRSQAGQRHGRIARRGGGDGLGPGAAQVGAPGTTRRRRRERRGDGSASRRDGAHVRDAGRRASSARRRTCRPSRPPGSRSTSAATSTASPSCSTSSSACAIRARSAARSPR